MPLPDFLVIGAYKCGTTSLHHELRRHPELFVPSRKEPNFFAFDGNPSPNARLASTSVTRRDEYEALFDGARPGQLRGEVSPEYMAAASWSAGRIKAEIPAAKLIAVLRNPVDRAWSDYLMYVRDGLEPCRDLRQALEQQAERRARGAPGGAYLTTGYYATQLAPFFDEFGPDQLHVLLFDDLLADPAGAMAGIYEFLGVRPLAVEQLEHANVSGVPRGRLLRQVLRARRVLVPAVKAVLPRRAQRSVERAVAARLDRPRMDPGLRAELAEHFADEVRRLERLIGRDLSGWLA